jgi:hypothetical protein
VLFEQGRWFRGKISLTGTEQLAGQTLVIGIDGLNAQRNRPICAQQSGPIVCAVVCGRG